MTVSIRTSRVTYLGAGSTGPFPYAFRITAAMDLVLVKRVVTTGVETALAYPGDYAVSGVGNGQGGSVILTQALAAGESLSIRRVLPVTQPTSLRDQGQFFAATHEDALDRLTMIDQQQEDAIGRAVRLHESFDPADFDLSLPTPEAAKAIVWNVAGTGFDNADLSSAQLSPWSAAQNMHEDVFVAGTHFTAGTTTTLPLFAAPGNAANVQVVRTTSGVPVIVTSDQYAVVGSTLTFGAAIPTGTTRVQVRYLLTYQVNLVDAANATWNAAGAGAIQRSVRDKLRGVVAVNDFAPAGSGIADDRAALLAGVAAVGTDGTLALEAGTYRVASDLTITSALYLAPGAIITPDSGVTVTITGALFAADGQIFDTSAGGIIALGQSATPTVRPAWFGTKGNGTSDDTVALQSAFATALRARKSLYAPGQTFLITSPLHANNTDYSGWPIFVLQGEASSSAIVAYQEYLAGRQIPGTTIVCSSCSGIIVTLDDFNNESVKLGGVNFIGIGTQANTFGLQLQKHSGAYSRKQFVEDVNFANFRTAIEFLGLSTVLTDNYIGTTVFNKVHTYGCGTGISFNNIYANLCQFNNCLIHVCTDYGFKCTNGGAGGGGVVGVFNTHFEACEPAAHKTSGVFTQLALHNATTEACGVISGKGAWDLGSGTVVTISGNSSVPGTGEVPPLLPANCDLYSSVPVAVRGAGGFVATPAMVTLVPDATTKVVWGYFPADQLGTPFRQPALFSTGYSPAIGGSNVPANLRNRYLITGATGTYDISGGSIAGLPAAPAYVVATFLYKTATGQSEGLGVTSTVTIGGTLTPISQAFTLTKNIPLVVQVVIFQPALAAITLLALGVRNPEWASSAWVSQETTTGTMLRFGHPPLSEAPVSPDRGDVDVTLVPGVDVQVQRFLSPLTAPRLVTLSTVGAIMGDLFTILHNGLGAHPLGVGGLKTIPSGTAARVDVIFDGGAWQLYGYQLL